MSRTWRRALYSNGATRAWEACIRRDHGDDVMRILKNFEAPRGPAWMRTRRAYRGLADPGPDPTGKGPAVECDWDVGPYGTGGTDRMPAVLSSREPTAVILEVRSVARPGAGWGNFRAAERARWAQPGEFPREADEHEYEHLAVWEPGEPKNVSFPVRAPNDRGGRDGGGERR